MKWDEKDVKVKEFLKLIKNVIKENDGECYINEIRIVVWNKRRSFWRKIKLKI